MRKSHHAAFIALLASFLVYGSAAAQAGALDPSFGTGGIVTCPEATLAVVPQNDTTLLISGIWDTDGIIQHRHQDGTLDVSFGMSSGYTFFPAPFGSWWLWDMIVAPDGSIYASGPGSIPGQAAAVLVRVLPDGTPDPSFGTNGVVNTPFGGLPVLMKAMLQQADGRIVVAGEVGSGAGSNALLLRYMPDGDLDSSFSGDGIFQSALYPPGVKDVLEDVVQLSDGSIVACGTRTDGSQLDHAFLLRLDAQGALMPGFGTGGLKELGLSAIADNAQAIEVDGLEFYVGGWTSPVADERDVFVAKYDANGAEVTGYGAAGIATLDVGQSECANDLLLLADERMVLAGYAGATGSEDYLVAVLHNDGTPDNSFGTGGAVTTSIQTQHDEVCDVAVQPDGKLVVVGLTGAPGAWSSAIVRYLMEGSTAVVDGPGSFAQIAVSPNPVHEGSLLVRFDDSASHTAVRIMDLLGRPVSSTAIAAPGSTEILLPVSALSSGVYQVTLRRAAALHSTMFIVAR